ncbi:putative transporter subunit: permease component of ABC superfamily [Methylacidimicrobium sp. AP8]|uniref:ABC transporter permease n=1 Tax=Methylacidimicrobium sp. AP8 TaxID=2730359 RepID=UPI0018C16CC7|nr:ABC transporter permease [Methylacidimicrobium sp. AP8]CAB4242893.1 putative transporter subunit: permease component of ABC superfamily [Methylacidimicrobium sp. AP8]
MRRIFGLIVKELLALFRDKRSRFVVIGPPLIQLIVFGYGATFDVNRIAYVVFDEENSGASRDLLARFEGSRVFRCVGRVHSDEEIVKAIDRKKALLVLHVRRNFSRDLFVSPPARMQAIVDGRNSNTAGILLGYVNQIVLDFNADWLRSHGMRPPPAVLQPRAWFNPNLESRWFIVPGLLGTLTLVVSIMTVGLSVAREREAGTLDQLLVTPMTPLEIVLGKVIPGFLVAMGELTLILLTAILWFRIPFVGNLLALYVGLAFYSLATIGVGLIISSISMTQQQALLGSFFFLSPAIVLSGFSTPIRNMPELVQWLTLLNPLRYALVVTRRVFLEGAGFGEVWPQFLPMVLIAAATLLGAWWVFRRRVG